MRLLLLRGHPPGGGHAGGCRGRTERGHPPGGGHVDGHGRLRACRCSRDRTLDDRTPDDCGEAAVPGAILYPLVLLLVLAIVQAAVYFHAQNVAREAASGAVQVTRLEGESAADGRKEARARLADAGGVLQDARVAVTRTSTMATAQVSGLAPSLVPGIRGLRVRQTATGPVERVTQLGAAPDGSHRSGVHSWSW